MQLSARFEGALIYGVLNGVITPEETGLKPVHFRFALYRRSFDLALSCPGITFTDVAAEIAQPGTATTLAETICENMGASREELFECARIVLESYLQERLSDLFIRLSRAEGSASHRTRRALKALANVERILDAESKRRNDSNMDTGGRSPGDTAQGKGTAAQHEPVRCDGSSDRQSR